MTEIERKALELVNEVILEVSSNTLERLDPYNPAHEAVRRAIEQHEAFRQEVSDAVQTWVDGGIDRPAWIWFRKNLERFIITKPDPLVEVLCDMGYSKNPDVADDFRAVLAKRGGRIVLDD